MQEHQHWPFIGHMFLPLIAAVIEYVLRNYEQYEKKLRRFFHLCSWRNACIPPANEFEFHPCYRINLRNEWNLPSVMIVYALLIYQWITLPADSQSRPSCRIINKPTNFWEEHLCGWKCGSKASKSRSWVWAKLCGCCNNTVKRKISSIKKKRKIINNLIRN
jgi:hypothetical protein